MTTTLVGILSVMFAAQATPVPAAPTPVVEAAGEARQTRTAIRANGMLAFDFGAAGIEVNHAFNRYLAVQGALDGVTMSRGNGGMYAELLLRAGVSDARHGINLGIGPGLFESPSYGVFKSGFGTVAFFVPEIAYEYRPIGGLSVAAGIGFPIVLNDSLEVPCESSGIAACLLETTQFHRGDVSPRLRLAVGYSF